MNRAFHRVAALVVVLSTASSTLLLDLSTAHACAACACGDPTLTTLGNDRSFAGRVRVSSVMRYRQLEIGQDTTFTQLQELQLMLAGAASLTDRLTVGFALPLTQLTVDYANLARDRSAGLQEVRLSSRWTALSHRNGRTQHIAGLRLELGIPAAPELTSPDGRALPMEAQLDPGSWKAIPALWYGYFAYPWSLQVSARIRLATEGRQQYQQGLASFIDLQSQYQLATWFALSGGFHSRMAAENTQAGTIESDTGGAIAFVSAGMTVALGQDTNLHLKSYQPVYAALEGYQHEKPLYEMSLTFDL